MIIFIFVATLVITAIVCLVRSVRQSGPPLTQDERVRVSQAISKNIQENSRHSFEAARLQAPIVHILDKGISVMKSPKEQRFTEGICDPRQLEIFSDS